MFGAGYLTWINYPLSMSSTLNMHKLHLVASDGHGSIQPKPGSKHALSNHLF